MKKENIPNQDLEILLKQVFKDDLPPEAEAKMKRHLRKYKRLSERLGCMGYHTRHTG